MGILTYAHVIRRPKMHYRQMRAPATSLLSVAIDFGVFAFLLLLFLLPSLPLPLLLLRLFAIFGWCDVLAKSLFSLLFHFSLHLFLPVLPRLALLCLLAQKVFSALDLQVDLALLLRGREGRVDLLGLVGDIVRHPALALGALLEIGQEAVPAFVFQSRVLFELFLDHEFFYAVDGVDVVHRVLDDPADGLQSFIWAHGGDRVSLHENVGFCEQLQSLERGSVGAENSLAALHEAVFVRDEIPYLYNV